MVLFMFNGVFVLQHHSPSEHEAGNWREPSQGNHCQGHLCTAAAAPQTLQTQPCLSGYTNTQTRLLPHPTSVSHRHLILSSHYSPFSPPCPPPAHTHTSTLAPPPMLTSTILHLIIRSSMQLLSSFHLPLHPHLWIFFRLSHLTTSCISLIHLQCVYSFWIIQRTYWNEAFSLKCLIFAGGICPYFKCCLLFYVYVKLLRV